MLKLSKSPKVADTGLSLQKGRKNISVFAISDIFRESDFPNTGFIPFSSWFLSAWLISVFSLLFLVLLLLK